MNQTQKRLNIIKLAISIGDNETIQLQLLKLAPLKTDEKIQEIIRGLQAENYAKTQALITEYIETAPEEVLQRTYQKEATPAEEEAIIEEFDLFRIPSQEEQENPTENNNQHEETAISENDLDSLLSLTGDDVLTETPDIRQTTHDYEEDDFFALNTASTEHEDTQMDNFFQSASEKKEILSITEEEISSVNTSEDEKVTSEASNVTQPDEEAVVTIYEPIPYIDQKLKTMQTQYPTMEEPESTYPSVDTLLIKISNEGYTEQEVEETIDYIQKLKEKGEMAEAAQLLLISAATHSKYAQFMLARALFKGDLLQQNLPEAFTLINRLAMDDDYPEAICDLGQMYEYGIGIDKDRRRAEELYKEAMELGIKRAEAHYERVHRENKGLFGRLFSKK